MQNLNVCVKSPVGKVSAGNRIKGVLREIAGDYKRNRFVIFMAVPVVLWYIIFDYLPMYGIIISFKDFSNARGIMGSPWVGLKHFTDFFNGYYAWRIIRNTLILSFYQLLFGFPAPLILALLLNEVKNKVFVKTVQTITYLPHFISMVVLCGMIVNFVSYRGIINDLVVFFGGERASYLLMPEWFRSIYVSTGIWQNIGWGSIIYLAALTGIDVEQYEAAVIDGAGRFKQFLHVTLPGIAPTIVILLILNIGKMMSMGAEKVILLYNENTYETADIIASFVYRRGLINADYSFSAAVGVFNSVVNLILVASANYISRKFSETSLW